MKKATFLFVLTALLISSVSFAQSPATSYRSGYDWITRGYDLSNAYGGKITFKGAYLNGYPMGGDLILQGGYGYSHGTIYFKSGNSDAMKINGSWTYIQKIYDLDNPSYYLDLASTGTSLKVAGKIQTCGKIEAEEIEVKEVCAANINVKMDNLADYVFNEDYKLKSLIEVEEFISKNKHLPEMPSASEVKENGMNIAEMNNLLLKKIEELTLYLIELKKENVDLSNRIQNLNSDN